MFVIPLFRQTPFINGIDMNNSRYVFEGKTDRGTYCPAGHQFTEVEIHKALH